MTRFATNVGFAIIFIVAGSIASGLISWLGFMLFAIGYQTINGYPFEVDYNSIFERLQFVTFLAVWFASTLWLFRKKRKVDYRWNSEKYLHCLRCGYDLRGNQSNKCSECGYKMTSIQQDSLSINDA